MADQSGAVDLAVAPQAEVAYEEGPQDERDKPKVLTAFAVVVGFDGNPQVISYEHDDFIVQHEPTPDLIFGAAQTIIKDITAQDTAQATFAFQMQQARAIAQQQQAQQITQNLGNLRG